jgi:multidrug efflux pump subunit AcrA (membrane-fusion protein)
MLHLILASPTATSWYGGPPAYDDRTLHAIGVAIMIGSVVLFAWVWQLFANSSRGYDDEQKRPLWAYTGPIAIAVGAQGTLVLVFSRRYSPLLLILSGVGIVITVLAIKSGKFTFPGWRRKRIDV